MNGAVSTPVGIGVVGAGVISDQYLSTLVAAPDVNVLIISDLDDERAQVQAHRYGIPSTGSIADVVTHPDVEIVVNLTVPSAHVEVGLRAIRAGKNVWTEKPLATDRRGGRLLLDEAARSSVRLASAPDTMLGAGFQTARQVIESGVIGDPLTATTAFHGVGPETWHPNPAFLYAPGAGPLMDMGPYFISGLIQIFGGVESVAATASKSRSTRQISQGPNAGTDFAVRVPTHVSALIRFEAGGSAESSFSFQSPVARPSIFEVVGSTGIARLPDPNTFTGAIEVTRHDGTVQTHQAVGDGARGIGVVDLARAIRTGEPERSTGELGFHVLDVLVAIAESANAGQFRRVKSSSPVPPRLPAGWDPRELTL